MSWTLQHLQLAFSLISTTEYIYRKQALHCVGVLLSRANIRTFKSPCFVYATTSIGGVPFVVKSS